MRDLHPDDLTHLANLFHIHREALAHSGALKPIADAAMEELRKFAESLRPAEPEPMVTKIEPSDQGVAAPTPQRRGLTPADVTKGDLDANSTVEGELAQRQQEEAVETHFQSDEEPAVTRSR